VDGYLRHFENPDKLTAEDTLYMPSDALKIVVGTEVKHAAPTNYENDLKCCNFLLNQTENKFSKFFGSL